VYPGINNGEGSSGGHSGIFQKEAELRSKGKGDFGNEVFTSCEANG